jgi:hypothetical protein
MEARAGGGLGRGSGHRYARGNNLFHRSWEGDYGCELYKWSEIPPSIKRGSADIKVIYKLMKSYVETYNFRGQS